MQLRISPLRGTGYLQPIGKHIRLGPKLYTWQYNAQKHTIKTFDGKLAWDVWNPETLQQKIVLCKPNKNVNQQFKFVHNSNADTWVAQIVHKPSVGPNVKIAMDAGKVLVIGTNKKQQWLLHFMESTPSVQSPKPQRGLRVASSGLQIFGEEFTAVIQKDGGYLEGRIVGVVGSQTFNQKAFEEKLFRVAQAYVTKQKKHQTGLQKWKIGKPFAWEHGGAHMTLEPIYFHSLGKRFHLTFGKPYHFETKTSRWVALPVKQSSTQYKCGYECHLSIGQQRK